jgi:ferritin-like metal-binding protein YciE
MPIKDKQELFVWMLSDLRQGAGRSEKIYQEIAEIAQDPDIKEALNARAFISDKIQNSLDECFRIIGQKPVDTKGRLHDVFAEDFRRELGEIESKEGRRLFALAKLNRLTHLRIAEYEVLIALADFTGHYAVGVLLESCLADNMVFVERTRQLLRHRIEQRKAA